ncbi:glycosyltransferase family 87 protein [Novosphingobium ginsenosidimutans]|uniref:DUF2029 domain-containing protein n=1 Tax=Novosphingobium ginsenosidimutans TaxID=1176536 RepID=A0A5B8S2M7_9SPHN|nr:glycosyltransferase family 87 protein [Novosphingobium ginsenosidimutans]QEA15610.1 DUF2029 domain-containing protein [Novosphingobium ginsenosidimutans]
MLGWIRDCNWLDSARIEDYSRPIVLLYIPGLIFFLLVSLDFLPIRAGTTGTDFVSFWTAAKLTLEGKSPYDLETFYAAQSGSIYSFLYPPPFLVVVLPFGGLPYTISLLFWIAIGGIIFTLLAKRISPSSVWPILAMPALIINAGHGQNGALVAALFIGATLTIDTRPFFSGLLLGCLIIKPHFGLLFPVAFLCGRRWWVIIGGISGAAILATASVLILGPQAWIEFLSKGGEAISQLEDNALLLPKLVSAFGAIRASGGPLWLAYSIQGIWAAAAACSVAYAWLKTDAQFAMAVLATGAVLATPFVYSYDLIVLLIPLAWLAQDGMGKGFVSWVKPIMVIAFWMPLFDRSIAVAFSFNPSFLANSALLYALFRQYRLKDGRKILHDTSIHRRVLS